MVAWLPAFALDADPAPTTEPKPRLQVSEEDIIQRLQIRNWQDNVLAGLDLVALNKYGPMETAHAVRWMLRQQNANNANGTALPPHTVSGITFEEGTANRMVDAVTMKAYNGASPPPAGFIDIGTAPGFRLDPQGSDLYCYWRNASSEWSLSRHNALQFNYVERVCDEL